MSAQYPLFVKRDLDGFFGLFIDNLVQLLLIVGLCSSSLCGLSNELIFGRILPGAAVSLLIGNLFYAWQAHRVARREGRSDVCALPYGINTPSLVVYVFLVIAPVYQATKNAELAWQMGLIACLGSGLIEFLGSFVAEWVRRRTPRAALLSTLAGIAITFIAIKFTLEIWQYPLIAMLPMGLILITYFAHARFPLSMPGGLVAVGGGTILAWLLPQSWTGLEMSVQAVAEAWNQRGWYLPTFCGGALLQGLQEHRDLVIGHLSVIVPMGLFNLIGSLQNIESAEAGGDRFDTRSSLAVNGLGTIAAALFGSCFPTTIYIGHPGWKGLGARAGYSTLNGVVITILALTGTVALISKVIPIQAGVPIVVWIGIVITAQAYQATPQRHAPAVAIGLFPAVAAWGATVLAGVLISGGGATMQTLLETNLAGEVNGFLIHGMNLLSQGFIFTCMVLAAISAYLIDRKFFAAAFWSLLGAVLTGLGLMHAYQLFGNEVRFFLIFSKAPDPQAALAFRGFDVAVGYLMVAVLFVAFGFYHRYHNGRIEVQDD